MAYLSDWQSFSDDYASYHTTAGNRLTHLIGIPLIMLSVVRWTQFGSWIPWAALVLPLYFLWAPGLGFAMAVLLGAMAWLAPQLSSIAIWACFLLGWVFQLLGHQVYEKRSPAFTRNAAHLLVGPLWIMGEALSLLAPNLKKNLRNNKTF